MARTRQHAGLLAGGAGRIAEVLRPKLRPAKAATPLRELSHASARECGARSSSRNSKCVGSHIPEGWSQLMCMARDSTRQTSCGWQIAVYRPPRIIQWLRQAAAAPQPGLPDCGSVSEPGSLHSMQERASEQTGADTPRPCTLCATQEELETDVTAAAPPQKVTGWGDPSLHITMGRCYLGRQRGTPTEVTSGSLGSLT